MTSAPAPTSTTPRRAAKMTSNQNLNHLLNFTLPPRQSQPFSNLPRRSRRTATQHGVWNKERFVNAQYRFVMNPLGDYTVHFADPDIFFQWNDILQVIIPRSSALASAAAAGKHSGQEAGHITCPICLSPPTAPRMTKCGHIFCFPCILHYLNTSENKWARCPICFDSVNASQLKSVKWFDGPVVVEEESEAARNVASSSSSLADVSFEATPRAGATMRMRLIQRPQITTLALPRSRTWPSDLLPPHQAPFHFLPDVFNYAKFMLATSSQLVSDLTRDLDELAVERRILSGMNDDLGISFIEGAEQKVRNQIAKASALDTPTLRDTIEKAHRDYREIETRFALHDQRRKAEAFVTSQPILDVPEEYLALKSTSSLSSPASETHPPTPLANTTTLKPVRNQNLRFTHRQRRNVNPPPPSTSTYYYYQAASGLPIYLHPLDIKILLSHFGEYASFPDNITIRVDAFSEGTVNDNLRKRCKYLAHMPEGADVVFIEADLEGVVGVEGLKSFEGALKTRKGRRKERGKKDDRARARAEEREREKREYVEQISWDSPTALGMMVSPEPVVVVEPEEVVNPTTPVAPQQAGVWGQASFASALRSSASTRGPPRSRASSQREEEDEWDLDIAWDELEQRSGGTGRRKRSNKLVVLGGGGGRRGR